MGPQIRLMDYASGHLIGARATAAPLRNVIEAALLRNEDVVLNFSGVQATQSFIDELIGVLILKNGPDILNGIIFRACSPEVKAIIEFVAFDRCDQYLKTRSH